MNNLLIIRKNPSDYNSTQIVHRFRDIGIKCHLIDLDKLHPMQIKRLLKCVMARSYEPIQELIRTSQIGLIEQSQDMTVEEVITELAYDPELIKTPIIINERKGATIGRKREYKTTDYLRVA